MTTILGIKTNTGEESIVLAADTRIGIYDDNDELYATEKASKIRTGSFYALAFCGATDSYLESFFNYISRKKNFQEFVSFISQSKEEGAPKKFSTSPLAKAVKENYFEALNYHNRFLAQRNDGKIDDAVELVLAVNKPSLQLFTVDAFGNLNGSKRPGGLEYVCAGAGVSEVHEYFSQQEYQSDALLKNNKVTLDHISLPRALQMAISAINKASLTDKGTGEVVDLVVLKKDKIDDHSSKALKSIDQIYKKIIERYQ